MPLQIEVISEHKELMGDDAVRHFNGHGGTIGRGLHSDWILPDQQRFISGKHATIDFRGGAYYLADISTNGVYVNDADEPLGKGNPRRLFDGDRLRMGEFEFVVTIDEGEEIDIRDPSAVRSISSDDHMSEVVPEEPLKTGIQLLDEEELTGDDVFQSTLFGTTKMHPEPRPAQPVRRRANGSAAVTATTAPAPAANADADDDALLAAFLRGAGVERDEIHPSIDPLDVMENAGRVLRELVSGTTDLLACRANLKSMFRLDQTTVLPRHNNPLKLSQSVDDSMKQLLVGREGEYLGPLDSVTEVCRDLKGHHEAMLEAMLAAFHEFADRFDPDELKDSFDRSLGRKPLLGSFAKLKYWQLYCDLYPIMTQKGSGPLPQQVGEEFVRAYEKRIAESKRVDRKDGKAA